ncbi:MAG TPA: Rieske 2Fe-2S domain-containing protein [Trebonia sp.]|jgi:phthalate 4,5-dioxygenase oxygenase subunit|nr:Rieske 2Fe-2S domain-containing protein [Trebonia sp.]
MLNKEHNDLLTRVGRGTPTGDLFRRFWWPVITSERLGGADGSPKRMRVLGEDLIVFRDTEGKVGVLQAYCPHRRALLYWGRNEERGLRCAYHGWKFDVSGQCVDMPTEPPDSTYAARLATIGYPAEEKGGVIWVYLGPKDKIAALPDYEWMTVPAENRVVTSFIQESNYLQALEANIDTAHVSYLHSYLDADAGPQPPQFMEGYRRMVNGDRSPRLTVKQTEYGLLYGGRRSLPDGKYYWRMTHWLAPATTQLPSTDYGNGTIVVPMDDHSSMSFSLLWHKDKTIPQSTQSQRRGLVGDDQGTTFKLSDGYVIDHPRGFVHVDNDYLIDRAMEATKFIGTAGGTAAEDRAVTETMGPVPDTMGKISDRSEEHLGVSDVAIVAARRALIRMVKALQDGVEPELAQRGDLYHVRGADIVTEHEDFEGVLTDYGQQLVTA